MSGTLAPFVGYPPHGRLGGPTCPPDRLRRSGGRPCHAIPAWPYRLCRVPLLSRTPFVGYPWAARLPLWQLPIWHLPFWQGPAIMTALPLWQPEMAAAVLAVNCHYGSRQYDRKLPFWQFVNKFTNAILACWDPAQCVCSMLHNQAVQIQPSVHLKK